ncbi:hypothetical protein Asp14428_05650 [Actinoplanes sp. NBRC 14428]|nr:hypothetical protein Asp14428_05650 [Actinoplanes sp. NBRC 14428]
MAHRIRVVLALVLGTVLGGAAVLAGAGPSAGVPAGAADHVLRVTGAGPYRIGVALSRLTEAGLVDAVATDPDRPGTASAVSTGDWAGQLLLTFHRGALMVVETATGDVRTAAGARVGMSFDEVAARYGKAGRFVTLPGGGRGYLVRVGRLALLFGDHPIRPGVGSIQAGPTCLLLGAPTTGDLPRAGTPAGMPGAGTPGDMPRAGTRAGMPGAGAHAGFMGGRSGSMMGG